MRANIVAAQKSYGKVSAAAKKDPAAAARLKEIEKHHTGRDCAVRPSSMPRAAKPQGDATKICAACDGIGEQLDGADEVHKKLVKQLKIAPLEPPAP